MASVFSHPAFIPSSSYNVVGYNLVKSSAVNGAPNYFGPWNPVSGYTGYTGNLDIYDASGSQWDLYRVQPIIQSGTGPQIQLDFSRPFTRDTPLFDNQITALIETFRRNWLDDVPIPAQDSTIPTESTGMGALPFISDANTSRFFLSYMANSSPVKFRPEETLVYSGTDSAHVTPLIPYTDYFPAGEKGYIDFATNPALNSYLRVEYKSFRYTDDEVRSMLLNSVSSMANWGMDDRTYQVTNSWNYYYLVAPLPNRDAADILCAIALRNILGSQIQSSFQASEAWKIGRIEYTADPSRSIQAGTVWHTDLASDIRRMVNGYIQNNRVYFSRGEYDSFFDNSGIMYPPFSVYNVFNYMSWWL